MQIREDKQNSHIKRFGLVAEEAGEHGQLLLEAEFEERWVVDRRVGRRGDQ